MCACRLSHDQLFATPWTVDCQAPLSMEFFRQEYWSGLPFPPAGDLSYPRIKPMSPVSPALAGGFFTTSTLFNPHEESSGGGITVWIFRFSRDKVEVDKLFLGRTSE